MLLTCRLHIGDSQTSLRSRGNQDTIHTLVVCLGVEFEVGGLHLVVCLGVEFEAGGLHLVVRPWGVEFEDSQVWFVIWPQ